jgi:hypothetical protein
MKTLKQYFDSLTPNAQEWIKNECEDWFDINEPDYYKKAKVTSSNKVIENYIEELPEQVSYYSSLNRQTLVKLALESMINNPAISQATIDKFVVSMVNKFASDCTRDIHMYVSDKYKAQVFDKRNNESYHSDDRVTLDIAHYLYTLKDFSEIKLNWDKIYEDSEIVKTVMEDVLGRDNYLDIISKNNTSFVEKLPIKQMNDIFDELFFCRDTWNKSEKLRLLKVRYVNQLMKGESEYNLKLVEDFMERIVAVDHKYLRYLYNIVEKLPSLATEIYEQKKPDEELTGNESIPQTYRYSKDIRKLAKIAHACARKSVSKVNSAFLKEISPLLKIYGYNFNTIYDALYPEDESIF